MITTALRNLLAESVDYAGLFPPTNLSPANLSLEAALGHYFACQRHSQSWMMARFVCPSARLEELSALLTGLPDGETLRLAVVGRLDKKTETPLAELATDLGAIAALRDGHGERVRIEFYETPLPVDYSLQDTVALRALLEHIHQQFEASALRPLTVFLEAGGWQKLQTELGRVSESLAAAGGKRIRFGCKIRLGGIDPPNVPSPSDVAEFIVACCEAGCIWKATAGLHQPLGHWDGDHNVFHFGFLSLLAAAILARVHSLRPAEVQKILEETDIENFGFDGDNFSWRERMATASEITSARNQSLVSFGSCSFEEPIAGLQHFGLSS